MEWQWKVIEELGMDWKDEMKWNESSRMELDKSECDWSGWEEEGVEMDGNECIENINANENEKQRWVVMRVMELK